MKKADFEARRALIQADLEQNQQEVVRLQQAIVSRETLIHTLNGALQDVNHWLAQLDKEEKEAAEKAASAPKKRTRKGD